MDGSATDGYRPSGQYLWDFWILRVDDEYHLFHLEAPTDLTPAERHHRARIGHAVSTDLESWERVGVALAPADDPEAWDGKSLWTGWTLEDDGTYYLFYTGRSEADGGDTQRIGVATSDDLRAWKRHPSNPVLTADETQYAGRDAACNGTVAWRDPCVVRDPASGDWLAFVTARDRGRPRGERGCIARARSPDLVDWRVEGPALSPGRFRDIEVPSLHERDGRWYLLFSVQAPWYAEEYAAALDSAGRHPETGVRYATAGAPTDRFVPRENPLVGTAHRQYTGRVVTDPAGSDVFLTWHVGAELGGRTTPASYSLAPPRYLAYGPDGELRLPGPGSE